MNDDAFSMIPPPTKLGVHGGRSMVPLFATFSHTHVASFFFGGGVVVLCTVQIEHKMLMKSSELCNCTA